MRRGFETVEKAEKILLNALSAEIVLMFASLTIKES